MAKADTSIRGYLSAKGNYYLNNANKDIGGRSRAQIEQETKINRRFALVNQLRFAYSTLHKDLSTNPHINKKDTQEFYLGDNYFKYKSASWVLQTGYQDVGWGEAFGFNYADIINPKDLRETSYTDYADSKIPLFLVNFKYFSKNSSLQLIYSPEPRFSRSLPVDLLTKGILPQTNINMKAEETPDFFKKHEFGGKLAISYRGVDTSLFYFSYLDRDASYILRSATLSTIELEESHARVKATGASIASTIYDNFVLRTDIVYTQDKQINSMEGFALRSHSVDMANAVFSLDTPTYNNFSGVFVVAASRLSENLPQAFRAKNQAYSITKIAYDLGEEKTIDLSYTHEWSKNGHAIQSIFLWPINETIEIRIGAENYWGEKNSQLNKIKNVSNVFLGIKNYFQL